MTKKELVAEVARKTSLTRVQTEHALDMINEVIIEETKAGNEVYIGEIGKIKVKRSSERQGRNPATGETLTIKAKNNPVFKPSISYKQILNK